MGMLDRLAGFFGYSPKSSAASMVSRVGFAAAELGRLTSSLAGESEYINNTLRYELKRLRARSRQVAQNNPFGRRFAQMVVDNVGGPLPFRLQAKVKFASGKLDTAANSRIESAWRGWGRKGNCELTGRFSWNAVQRLLFRTMAVDGEILMRIRRGDSEYGPYRYQVQVIDVDRLDDMKNERLANGGAIHMGVELDAVSRPVAYHILKRKPSSWASGGYPREHERVPADEIIHLFVPEFAEQVRGVPWMYAALLNLVHIGAFEEAAVIAARVGAAQMGVLQSPDGGKTLADGLAKDASGSPQIEAEPGTFAMLPPGYELQGWNPRYPDAAIEPFLKACLRGVSVGLNVAYHNLAGDMEGVNYSSARIAELDERDHWMTLQAFLSEHLHDPLYRDWLKTQVASQVLPFEIARLEKYRDVYWQARRWAWVDPLKEANAAVVAIDAKLKSRTRVIAEGGEDIEDVFGEIAEENKLATEMKIELVKPAPAAPAKPEDPDEGAADEAATAED